MPLAALIKLLIRIGGGLCILLAALIVGALVFRRNGMDRLLAFEAARPKNIAIYLADPGYGLALNLTRGWVNNTEPVWSPDGRLTFVSSVLLDQDVYTLTLDQPAPINISGTNDSHSPAWSPGGRLAYVTDEASGSGIDVVNPDGSRRSYTGTQFGSLITLSAPSWLNDHELVFIGSLASSQPQVFLLNLDDDSIENISNAKLLIHREPAGSPDGRWVAFIGDDQSRAQARQIISVWDKASGRVTQVTANTGLNAELSWSKDGRLAFASTMSGNLEIYVWDAQTGALRNVSNDAGVDEFPAWSANGDLAFVSNRSGEAGVYQINPISGMIQAVYILHGSSFPVWSN